MNSECASLAQGGIIVNKTAQKADEEKQLIKIQGRGSVHLRLHLTVLVIAILCEWIGIHKFRIGPGSLVLLPMLYAVVIGILITPDVLGKKIDALKKIISAKECKLATALLGISLLPLGVKYGTLVGPNMPKILKAGPAFILQEFGNLGTIAIALPLALLLGLKREAIGGTVSICREATLGVVSEYYGIDSPEGRGVLGTYLTGTLLGTIFFGILGGLAPLTGLHPQALAMACGIGSASMMTAASSSLATAVPEMKDTILAYAATSNLLTGVTGMYMVLIFGLPLVNFLYRKLEPVLGRKQ
ncbi:hypothetical protein CSB45_09400 [candidate division KSB3 bacterium]|uniref:DUF3100 domain-containing protein n=1 Tax=candidate division KSB3 bacterium TaxID=2044937 RepID=A0A2G6E543_9BACT|nr:MAG: hypothetical protein CSB45_09400 [candidate division KSB3 bacterium]PIE29460.1 MAG: hypothetical protein CSA57_08675 [candidate division KSB3 bacterium]